MEKETSKKSKITRVIQQISNDTPETIIADNRPGFMSDMPLQREQEDDVILPGRKIDAPPKNETGLPDNLKAGVESLSGFSLNNVRVHYNSSKPATVQALAYTQGTDIHVAPGQEKHLPHEVWHVTQQMAGRVAPTTIINGVPVNDNEALEHEADVMGKKAVQCKENDSSSSSLIQMAVSGESVQRNADENQVNTREEDLEQSIGDDVEPLQKKPDCFVLYYETESKNQHILKDAHRIRGKRSKSRTVREADLVNGPYGDIKNNESIIIVSHGSRLNSKANGNVFAGKSPEDLAMIVLYNIIAKDYSRPIFYHGEIFLDGCYTGEPLKRLNDGTSYAERFGKALSELFINHNSNFAPLNNYRIGKSFIVKGNLGAASTTKDGRELVELDRHNRRFFEQNAIYSNDYRRSYDAVWENMGLEGVFRRLFRLNQYGGSIGKRKYKFYY